ncbi:MAG: DNA cytosine methyltransferase, partial [Oscillospiraceae bacterium]|nr:DNA cytosine methyltransferase [Oscillospiraceae bacterium]
LNRKSQTIELFSGAGGLALGLHQAGIEPIALLEWDKGSCATIKTNIGNSTNGISKSIQADQMIYPDCGGNRWQTVRDAIAGLPDPTGEQNMAYANHEYRGGAKSYAGHSGSTMDEPSKTIKAGVHGVPGGENMLTLDDGRLRYYTERESARIQTFPDNYRFCGSWTESMRQISNAVPVRLANVIGESVVRHFNKEEPYNAAKNQPPIKPYNPLDKQHLGKSITEALLHAEIQSLPPELSSVRAYKHCIMLAHLRLMKGWRPLIKTINSAVQYTSAKLFQVSVSRGAKAFICTSNSSTGFEPSTRMTGYGQSAQLQ